MKHTIVLRDPSLADDEPQVGEYDAGALVRVVIPALEKAASPAGGKARAASPRRAASPGRAPPASKSATTPGQRKPSPKRTSSKEALAASPYGGKPATTPAQRKPSPKRTPVGRKLT